MAYSVKHGIFEKWGRFPNRRETDYVHFVAGLDRVF